MKQLTLLLLACLTLACAQGEGEPPVQAEAAEERGVPAAADAMAFEDTEVDGNAEEHPDLIALREQVAAEPDNATAHRRLGVALRHTGKSEEAFQYLTRATELAPDDISARLSLGIAYAAEHRLTEAEAAYRHILGLEPQHAKALHNLGNVAMRRGNEEEAIALYRRATEADPEYIAAYLKLADLLKYHGRPDEAYPVYEKILTLKPQGSRDQLAMIESMYGMGAINLTRQEYETAEKQLAQVTRIMPQHRSAHWARAQALIQLGRHEEAQEALQAHVGTLVDPGGDS
jgi:tetratricopeptide (TPR) repeat protein